MGGKQDKQRQPDQSRQPGQPGQSRQPGQPGQPGKTPSEMEQGRQAGMRDAQRPQRAGDQQRRPGEFSRGSDRQDDMMRGEDMDDMLDERR